MVRNSKATEALRFKNKLALHIFLKRVSHNEMDETHRMLYCGNISEEVTEDLLYELFQQAGPLESVSIAKDKEGNRRNYAFITFRDVVSVNYTIALMKGISLFGNPLRLERRTGAESDHNPYLEQLVNYQKKTFGYSPGAMQDSQYSPCPGSKRSHWSGSHSYSEENRRSHRSGSHSYGEENQRSHRSGSHSYGEENHRFYNVCGERFYADASTSSNQQPIQCFGHSPNSEDYENNSRRGTCGRLQYTPNPWESDYSNIRGSGGRSESNRNMDGYSRLSDNSFGFSQRENVRSSYSSPSEIRANGHINRNTSRDGRNCRQRNSFDGIRESQYVSPEMPEYPSRHGYGPYYHRNSDRSFRNRIDQN